MKLRANRFVIRYHSQSDESEALYPQGLIYQGQEVDFIQETDDSFCVKMDEKVYWCGKFNNRKNRQEPNFDEVY